MKNILIYPEDIIPNAKYICDAEGRCDLVGQILVSGFGIRLQPKTRTPQDLQTQIKGFVICIRQYTYSHTPLALQLLANSYLPPRKQIAEANKLLNPLGLNLLTERDLEEARNK